MTEEQLNRYIEHLEIPHLSHEVSKKADGLLTYEECKKSLDTFSPVKSPGEDGFTVEFYSAFFDLIGNDLFESFIAAYENGQLSISQRRGVITLIPKEESSPLKLQNWRPITLSNVDYKIASKAIAKRIEQMLPSLIHPDQTGFVKGRYIGENIRVISDVMEQTKKLNCPGILLSLDFQKAFDTLEWSCIHNVLKNYNFDDSLRNWIKVFYTDIESAVLKVAHLDFSEAHHPNFERRILYCLSSVGQAASNIYQKLNELVKKVGLIDIGVTIATKR